MINSGIIHESCRAIKGSAAAPPRLRQVALRSIWSRSGHWGWRYRKTQHLLYAGKKTVTFHPRNSVNSLLRFSNTRCTRIEDHKKVCHHSSTSARRNGFNSFNCLSEVRLTAQNWHKFWGSKVKVSVTYRSETPWGNIISQADSTLGLKVKVIVMSVL